MEDFDADKVRPKPNEDADNRVSFDVVFLDDTMEYYPGTKSQPAHDRDLCDIDSSFLDRYCANLNVSMLTHKDGSFRGLERGLRSVYFFTDAEDGSVESEGELETFEIGNNINPELWLKAQNELGYYFNYIRHANGSFYTINPFSIVKCAYYCHKRYMYEMSKSKQYMNKHIYSVSRLSNCPIYSGVTDTMIPLESYSSIYKDLCDNLEADNNWEMCPFNIAIEAIWSIYTMLNINIEEENVRDYTEEKVYKHFPVKKLTTNEEFMQYPSICDRYKNDYEGLTVKVDYRNLAYSSLMFYSPLKGAPQIPSEQRLTKLTVATMLGLDLSNTSIYIDDGVWVNGDDEDEPLRFDLSDYISENFKRMVREVTKHPAWFLCDDGNLLLGSVKTSYTYCIPLDIVYDAYKYGKEINGNCFRRIVQI